MAKGDPARYNPRGTYEDVTERIYKTNSGRLVFYSAWKEERERADALAVQMEKLREEVEHLKTALECRHFLEKVEIV